MMNLIEDVRTRMGRRRRRLVILGACLATAVVSGFALWPLLSGKTEPPVYGRRAAEAALGTARSGEAARWAPEELLSAESAMRASLLINSREEARFVLFRDFTGARAAFRLVEEKSKVAAAEAARNRDLARAAADAAIDQAGRAVTASQRFADVMHIGAFERTLLQKSKLALTESKSLFGEGEFEIAAERARDASARARKVSDRAIAVASRYVEPGTVQNWRRMIDNTVAWSRSTGGTAIVVLKENHRLDLYDNGRLVKSYKADMGYRSIHDKTRSGDAATPEGRYRITVKKPSSTYYRALALNYPNEEDRAQFEKLRRAGLVPRGASPGSLIEIHGEGGRGKDWTRGCVAVSNRDMDDLFRRVGPGTPVTIVGGDGQGTFTKLIREHGSAGGASSARMQ